MGAVGFTEHRTATGNMMRLDGNGPLGGLLHGYVHSAQLLKKEFSGPGGTLVAQKEFSGPGGTLVAGQNVGNPSETIQHVDHKRFAAGGNNGRAFNTLRLDKLVGIFDRFRFGY